MSPRDFDALLDDLDQVSADAARYRWLKGKCYSQHSFEEAIRVWEFPLVFDPDNAGIDAVIDTYLD